ncbi:MAG: 2-hydroxyacid dehydrogenase [Cyanobacteria bacterium REEB446]|nr:2-hydroxyacid dehydrogenase [Cyanobacteria bacterium REEB446]
MKIAFFSTQKYDKDFFLKENDRFNFDLVFFEVHLKQETLELAKGYEAICVFVNDKIDQAMLKELQRNGTKLIALRCAGFNNINIKAAQEIGITVMRVPAYSPYAVAEHTLALILTLNRKIHKAYNRVRESNFSLDGLLGFDLYGKKAGIIGTGKIGKLVAKILSGFGCEVLLYDPFPDDHLEYGKYYDLKTLLNDSDIISIHCPLNDKTKHLINKESITLMKDGVMIINTSRGAIINTKDAIQGLKSCKIGYLGLDVYEEEEKFFFENHSETIIQDDVLMRLISFPNVIVTAHQAFFTQNAMRNIAVTTLKNIKDFEENKELNNLVLP